MSLTLGTIAALSALASLASTGIGTSKAAKKNKYTQRLIQSNLARAEAERKAKPQNYLDTVSGKAIVNQAGEQLRDNLNAVNNNAIKTGATNEQRLANSGAVQNAYNKIIQGVAQQSEGYNRYNDALLQNARNEYTKGQTGINNQAAQSYVNAGINTANAIGNLANAYIGYKGNSTATVPAKSATANSPAVKQTVQKPLINPDIMATRRNQKLFNASMFKMPNFSSGTQGLMETLRKQGRINTTPQFRYKSALFGNY